MKNLLLILTITLLSYYIWSVGNSKIANLELEPKESIGNLLLIGATIDVEYLTKIKPANE